MMGVNALTHKNTNIASEIKTPVIVTDPSTGKEYITQGIWDTGATGSVITKSVAVALGLKPVNEAMVHGIHGTKRVNVYVVKVTLNNQNISLITQVTECDELSATHDTGVLIGMNIISMGDFTISNFNGETCMTFRVPSLERIDYVEEISEHNKYLKKHDMQVAKGFRKDTCPCGSGKQWKNCHGKSKYFK